jgi:hypothetical protein
MAKVELLQILSRRLLMSDKMDSMDRMRMGRGGFNIMRMRARSRICVKESTKSSVQSVVLEEQSSVAIQTESITKVMKKK